MGKSYRFDRDDDEGFQSREQLRKAKKQNKHQRRETARETDRMDGGADEREAPFDNLSTIDPRHAG